LVSSYEDKEGEVGQKCRMNDSRKFITCRAGDVAQWNSVPEREKERDRDTERQRYN
jgi:hypothetical protein